MEGGSEDYARVLHVAGAIPILEEYSTALIRVGLVVSGVAVLASIRMPRMRYLAALGLLCADTGAFTYLMVRHNRKKLLPFVAATLGTTTAEASAILKTLGNPYRSNR